MSPGLEIESNDIANAEFVAGLGAVLEKLCQQQTPDSGRLTRFDAVRAPTISIQDYLTRLHLYFGCSAECFVLALVYVDRIVLTQPTFVVSHLNIHRIVLAATTIAAKFLDDVYYSNSYYGKVGGVRTKELNLLEARLLEMLQWKINVTREEYSQYWGAVLSATGARGTTESSEEEAGYAKVEEDSMTSTTCSDTETPVTARRGALSFYPTARGKRDADSNQEKRDRDWECVSDATMSDDDWITAQ